MTEPIYLCDLPDELRSKAERAIATDKRINEHRRKDIELSEAVGSEEGYFFLFLILGIVSLPVFIGFVLLVIAFVKYKEMKRLKRALSECYYAEREIEEQIIRKCVEDSAKGTGRSS